MCLWVVKYGLEYYLCVIFSVVTDTEHEVSHPLLRQA